MNARDRLRERRERHRSRSMVVRAGVALAGFATLLGGLALLVLPGPGIPLVVVGLSLLALEFLWAEAALGRILRHTDRIKPTTGRQRLAGGIAVLAAAGAAAASLVLWGIPGL